MNILSLSELFNPDKIICSFDSKQERLYNVLISKTDPQLLLQSDDDPYLLSALSHIRWNILEPADITDGEEVLELDGQNGILTEYLSKKAKSVTAIVCSPEEASLIKCRLNDTSNVSVRIAGGSDNDSPGRLYDVITLTGVRRTFYEQLTGRQCHSYKELTESYKWLLNASYELLKPGGRIIIAINNRLGLQYLNGKKDACSPGLFDTVTGSPDIIEYALSKNTLAGLLSELAPSGISFYYPVSDYRYARAIFSDSYLPMTGDIRPTSMNDTDSRYWLFDENKAFDLICEEGLFEVFANSYLVICRKKD